MPRNKLAFEDRVNGSTSEDNNKEEVITNVEKKTLDSNVADEQKINLANGRNTAVVVNDLVNHRYRDTFAELQDKLKKQRLALAEAQMKMKKRPFGVEMQYLRYIDNSYHDEINVTPEKECSISIEFSAGDETKKENSDSEEAKSTVEAQRTEKDSLDLNLLCLKLQGLKQSYENTTENWQDGFDGSISSENEDGIKEEVVENVTTQKVDNVDNADQNNIHTIDPVKVNGNMKNTVSFLFFPLSMFEFYSQKNLKKNNFLLQNFFISAQ